MMSPWGVSIHAGIGLPNHPSFSQGECFSVTIHVPWAPFIVLSKGVKVLSKDSWKALKVHCWKGGLCDPVLTTNDTGGAVPH